MRGINNGNFPEGELLGVSLQGNYRERQSLQQELKQRFRNEYLSQLVQRAKERSHKQPKVGDIVLVGSDDQKRINWPMAKIIELLPGRDGVVRTVRVQTQQGGLLRPIQRFYPLEVSSVEDVQVITDRIKTSDVIAAQHPAVTDSDVGTVIPVQPITTTKSGRKINKPIRLRD